MKAREQRIKGSSRPFLKVTALKLVREWRDYAFRPEHGSVDSGKFSEFINKLAKRGYLCDLYDRVNTKGNVYVLRHPLNGNPVFTKDSQEIKFKSLAFARAVSLQLETGAAGFARPQILRVVE